MKDTIHDDLELLDFLPESSATSISVMEELEEFEPRLPRELTPVDDFSFLIPKDKPDDYFMVIKAPEELIGLFDDLPEKKKVKTEVAEVPYKDIITSEMRIFLTHYMGSGTITGALRSSKISLARYKKWISGSPKFAQAVADSTDALADRLEAEALKQALSGNTKVLLKSLEALRPAKWGKNSTVNSFIDAKMKVEVFNWAELVQKSEVVDLEPVLIEGDESHEKS